MTPFLQQPDPPSQERADAELRIRVLHDLIPESQEFPNFDIPYISFLRSLRERLHPIGVRDIQEIETRSGLTFHVNLGDRLGCDFYYGFYGEAYDATLFCSLLEPGAIVVDVGANFGYYAISASSRVGPEGGVYAFEPDPAAYNILEGNIEANQLKNVRSFQVCIGDEDRETDFYLMEESAFSSMVATGRSREKEKILVPMRRLDSLFLEQGVERLDAIKVDVEGMEFAVLRGLHESLQRSPEVVLMIEINAKNLNDKRRTALESVLRDLYLEGFIGRIVDSQADGVRSFSDPGETATQASVNLFLVRSGSRAESRLLAMAKELRRQAFHGISSELSLDALRLLSRQVADPHSGVNLHAALLTTRLRDLHERIEWAEKNALQIHERLAAVEQDSQARLAFIHKLQQDLVDRQQTLTQLHEQHVGLKKELAYWKKEASVGIRARIWQRLRQLVFGHSQP